MNTRCPRPTVAALHAGGFVFLTALLMLSVVGAAMLALTQMVAADGFRTQQQIAEAQLSQLLIGGATDARVHLQKQTPAAGQRWGVELPQDLVDQGAKLTCRVTSIDANGDAVVRVDAVLDTRQAGQTVRLHRDRDQWRIIGAELE